MQGYKSLPFFKQATIIYDFTQGFCDRYISKRSRTHDQMVQAARSGKQNIAEGYILKSLKGRIKLLGVSRGSLEELLEDYKDFLRYKGLKAWGLNSLEAKTARALVYKKPNEYNNYNVYNDYKVYIKDGESAANIMVCLINQTNMLLDNKIRWMEEKFIKEGGYTENLFKKRLNEKLGL